MLLYNGEPVQIAEGPGVDDDTTAIWEIQGSAIAELRITELDQADPAGRYRLRVEGDQLLIQRAATANWATATTLAVMDADGFLPGADNTGNLGIAAQRWALIRGVTITSGDFGWEETRDYFNQAPFVQNDCLLMAVKQVGSETLTVPTLLETALDRLGLGWFKDQFVRALEDDEFRAGLREALAV